MFPTENPAATAARRRGRIGRRLVLWFAGSMAVVVATTGWALYSLTRASLEDQMAQRLVAVAQLVTEGVDAAPRLRPGYEVGLLHTRLRERLLRAADAVGARRIFVFDREGHSLIDTEPGVSIGRPYASLILDREELASVWRGETAHSVLFRDEAGA